MIKKLRTLANYLWQSWARDLLIVLLFMVPFRSSIADWNQVPSGSISVQIPGKPSLQPSSLQVCTQILIQHPRIYP